MLWTCELFLSIRSRHELKGYFAMMIKMNAKESLEIVENVFVNILNEHGALYLSWDEMSEEQQSKFSQIKTDVQIVYEKFKKNQN